MNSFKKLLKTIFVIVFVVASMSIFMQWYTSTQPNPAKIQVRKAYDYLNNNAVEVICQQGGGSEAGYGVEGFYRMPAEKYSTNELLSLLSSEGFNLQPTGTRFVSYGESMGDTIYSYEDASGEIRIKVAEYTTQNAPAWCKQGNKSVPQNGETIVYFDSRAPRASAK